MDSSGIKIARLAPADRLPDLMAQIDSIFFEASGRTFEPGAEREAFRERWLGRYLQGGTDEAIVALAQDGRVAGYLVGAMENPALQDRFADISYFRAEFAGLCRTFPAHLHINLDPAFRGRGIGGRLIEAFAARAGAGAAAGMHVVTGKGMRNVRFYERCGFAERGSTTWNGREIVFLGRDLART
ncbi:MAG: GNAT family N-acetyltransferase [Hyphomicrobiaceae bacterium]|nr:MAG: GNAT family N-acetyltransferase [Hyphomicrobiaceae bacterium]